MTLPDPPAPQRRPLPVVRPVTPPPVLEPRTEPPGPPDAPAPVSQPSTPAVPPQPRPRRSVPPWLAEATVDKDAPIRPEGERPPRPPAADADPRDFMVRWFAAMEAGKAARAERDNPIGLPSIVDPGEWRRSGVPDRREAESAGLDWRIPSELLTSAQAAEWLTAYLGIRVTKSTVQSWGRRHPQDLPRHGEPGGPAWWRPEDLVRCQALRAAEGRTSTRA